MNVQTNHSYRKLHAGLLIALLLVFALVYNRRPLLASAFPQPATADNSPNARRAAIPWNIVHADSALSLVKDGDLVLRSGSDAISSLFKKTNTRDKSWSHAGIVFHENGYPFVYNCIGSAADPEAVLRRDSLSAYISPYDNLGYAVFRYRFSGAQVSRLHDISIQYFKERRYFDPHFDLKSDSALYCTEFVYKAVLATTRDTAYLPITHTAHFDFVAVDNLFSRRDTKLICKIGYIQ